MAINYELLRTFLAAGAARTFAEAAARRRVSVSAISQQVKTLESQLGVPLFERVGRRVRLTDTGQRLLALLQEEFSRIDHALEAATAAHHTIRGRIVIGSPRAFGRYWLRPRLPGLLRDHPELVVEVEFGVPSLLERRLVDGAIDLCILTRPAELPGVATRPLHVETFVAVAAPDYLARWGTPASAEELQQHRFIVFDGDLAMHAPWWRAAFGTRIPLPGAIVCQIASLEEMLALAEAGVGIAVLPDYHVEEALAARRVVLVTPARGHHARQRPARNTLFLAWRQAAIETARLTAVREALARPLRAP